MNYNKQYYTNNGFSKIEDCHIDPVWGCECPYDKRLFITKDKVYATHVGYSLYDKASGLRVYSDSKLKNLKDWFLNKGREAYERVIKNNLANYEQRKANYIKLLEAVK